MALDLAAAALERLTFEGKVRRLRFGELRERQTQALVDLELAAIVVCEMAARSDRQLSRALVRQAECLKALTDVRDELLALDAEPPTLKGHIP